MPQRLALLDRSRRRRRASDSKEDAMALRSSRPGLGTRRLVGLAAVTVSLLIGAAAAGPASASAYGIQYWGAFTVNIGGQSVGIPSGQLAHEVSGSGRYIDYEWAHITTLPGFCNWRVDYVYRTVYNRVYRRIRTATHYRCDMWAYAPTVYPGRVRRGTACAQLYRSGVYVTKQCHSIF
jgi:hypothetical protein